MSPIGPPYDSAWTDYDHTSGPALITEAKRKVKTGSTAPNWRLRLLPDDFSRLLVSAEVTFSRDGDSGIRFTLGKQLAVTDYQRARVHFGIGYGEKVVPYFQGRLADPVDAPSGLFSDATAYGLGTQLGQRYFQRRQDYTGFTAHAAFNDIVDIFGADPDRFEWDVDDDTTLAADIANFGLEISLLEAGQTIFDPSQLISYDQTGGKRVVRRSHLAAMGVDSTFTGAGEWYPSDYPKGGFTFSESQANFYNDVVIFRRKDSFAGGGGPGVTGLGPASSTGADADEYDVYATASVATSGPYDVTEGRDYVVGDYPGSQSEAERDAALLAAAFSKGVGQFEWNVAPCDFSIGDHLTVYRNEEVRGTTAFETQDHVSTGRIDRVGYGCVVEEITLTLAPSDGTQPGTWDMTITGPAFAKSRTTL